MVFIVFSFLLGAVLATTGQVANQINSHIGMGISNKKVHRYVTNIGALSNRAIPIISIICATLIYGIKGLLISTLFILLGAFIIGLLRLSYHIKILIAVFGFPIALLMYAFSLSG